jgi:uncharacterized protein (DUF58 family)
MPNTETTTNLLSPELLARLERLELVSRKIFRGRMKGERRSPRKGQSVEFADFRNYVPGDDLRFIDWNLYARLDKMFLKLFLEEEDLHFHALIDASESMNFGEPTKLHFARKLAAALGYVGLCRADRVKLQALTSGVGVTSPALRGRASLWRMMSQLQAITPGQNVSLLEGVRQFCLRNTGKGIVVLITDLLDKEGYEPALRLLLAKQFDIYVIHVLSPEEMTPDLAGDVKLVDAEDGHATEISVSRPLLDRYRRTLNAFTQGAREFCNRRGITYILANSQMNVDDLVANYLRRRGLVR